MHFTLALAVEEWTDIYELLEKHYEWFYHWHEDWTVEWEDGRIYHEWEYPYTFYDWFVVWWRRDGYIKWKRWKKPLEECKPRDDHPEINWKDRWSVFYKSDIKWFGYDEKNLSKYPQLHSYYDPNYIEENWWLPEWPDQWQFQEDWKDDNTLDKEAFEKAKKEYEEWLKKWYDEIPDDYLIYIIDYHN